MESQWPPIDTTHPPDQYVTPRSPRGAPEERAMTSDFYRRLSQRRAAGRRRASFFARLLWRLR
ncbi:MAG: hypothetical protein H7Z42_21310 [Roseiflexaceae bacterium]|nr:hypothetical protein [Roseiflexaceae bacterium]